MSAALAAILGLSIGLAVPRAGRAPAPPPPVSLLLSATDSRDVVVFSLANTGAEPVRVLADRFLLSLELRPDGRRGGVRRCAPPAGLASGLDPDRIVTLDPGARYEESVDVRFWCWGSSKMRTKAHSIRATYGRAGRATADRWVVSSADGTAGHHGRLNSEPLPVAATEVAPVAVVTKRGLELRAADAQAFGGREVVLPLRVVNHGPDPVHVFLHPFAFRFRVSSAAGQEVCAIHDPERQPDREAFVRLARGAVRATRLDVAEFCPRGTFSIPGVYEVRAELAAAQDGASVGLRAFTGTVTAEPAIVRVSHGHSRHYVRVAPR